MAQPTLVVEHLKTQFFTRGGIAKAVDDVSFTVGRGEIMGLVGESGSGKSMTGYSIMGLVDAPGKVVDGRIALTSRDASRATCARLRRPNSVTCAATASR